MPERLDDGVLYVSLEHATMVHSCACGCGSEVVLTLSPTDWRLTYDGEAVSVWPSVGSWSLPCRSHYFIERGLVRWAATGPTMRSRRAASAISAAGPHGTIRPLRLPAWPSKRSRICARRHQPNPNATRADLPGCGNGSVGG
jgi:hypothetical protein